LSADDLTYLRRAVELAREMMARGDGPPFGAVVVLDGETIAEGANTTRASGDPSAHAELVAIRNACRTRGTPRLDGATVYASGEPCPMCLGLMYQTGIARYVFASSVEDAKRIGSRSAETYADLARDRSARAIRSEHLALPEAIDLLEQWRKVG
jgi:tRNA(Arg) A34 adenosine deaminase TadA